jgi:hypothetical protein
VASPASASQASTDPFVWETYPLGDRMSMSDINFGLYIVTRTK